MKIKVNPNPTFINGKIVEKDEEITSEPYAEGSAKIEIEPERFDELDKKADEFFLAYKNKKLKNTLKSNKIYVFFPRNLSKISNC